MCEIRNTVPWQINGGVASSQLSNGSQGLHHLEGQSLNSVVRMTPEISQMNSCHVGRKKKRVSSRRESEDEAEEQMEEEEEEGRDERQQKHSDWQGCWRHCSLCEQSVALRHQRNAVLQAALDLEGVIMESYYGSQLSPCHCLFQIESSIWVPVGFELTVMHPVFE